MNRLAVFCVMAIMGLVSACGGAAGTGSGSTQHANAGSAATPADAPPLLAQLVGQHPTPAAAAPHPSSGVASPSPTGYPQSVPGSTPAPVTARLAAACVSVTGKQALTIRTTPGFFFAFDAQYSDGQDGRKYGGVGYGQIPDSGTVTQPWVVAPIAPQGKVIVWISISGTPNQTAFRQPTFVVASSC